MQQHFGQRPAKFEFIEEEKRELINYVEKCLERIPSGNCDSGVAYLSKLESKWGDILEACRIWT